MKKLSFKKNPFPLLPSSQPELLSFSTAIEKNTVPPVTFSMETLLENSFVLENEHSNAVVIAENSLQKADAHVIAGPRSVIHGLSQKYLSIKTADCLPVVFYYEDSSFFVGGITHAGWRGLSAGIINNTIDKLLDQAALFQIDPKLFLEKLHVFFAPAIFGVSYECGIDVKIALKQHQNRIFSRQSANMPFLPALFEMCADVKQDPLLSQEIEKELQNRGQYSRPDTIFPDLQLLGAIECMLRGIPSQHLSLFRTNTFTNLNLPSFRRESQSPNSIERKKRLWTCLCL